MVKGIYHSSMGMSTIARKQELISNNLSNINTTGYKKSKLFHKAMIDVTSTNELEWIYGGGKLNLDEVKIYKEQGIIEETGSKFDLAIQGDGFFVVDTPQGHRYTRNGSFTRNKDMYLTTFKGDFVLDEGGKRIKIKGGKFEVFDNGKVSIQEQERLGDTVEFINDNSGPKAKLKIVTFDDYNQLLKEGDSLFKKKDNTVVEYPAEKFIIRQFCLERSNANALDSMVEMISLYRNFEANQKAIQAHDQTLDKAVNSVGRI